MRFLPILLLSSVAIGTAGAAAGPPAGVAANLRATLHSMMAPAQAKQADHDQGDDNAALRAIFVVCNHDNPSAQRSAICPAPISPS